MMKNRALPGLIATFAVLLGQPALLDFGGISLAQIPESTSEVPCCDFKDVPGVIWYGSDPKMTIRELAAYCGPIFWFSPDEPTMNDKAGKEIRIPEAFPFEAAPDSPVVYYQFTKILVRIDAEGPAYIPDSTDKNNSIIDLHNVGGIDLHYICYYHKEEGLGGHPHDVEPTEFKLGVWRRDECQDCRYVLLAKKVTGEAHGIQWYYNTLMVDEHTKFPMHLLVEEGKHAACTDKNGDGYYTPGYDVNRRINDAWGVRDVIRTGMLFTGDFQSWMAKVRKVEHRVFPPLPEDSPLREKYVKDGLYASDKAIYELRAYPSSENATEDKLLRHKIQEKEQPDWPEEVPDTDFEKFTRWLETESFVKSLSIALRLDGGVGVSFVFPLLIVKNVEDPIAGGWLLNRIYFQDRGLRDFGYNLLYTPSASRWIDSYFAVGVEFDEVELEDETTKNETRFVLESGIKFRVNITKSPLKFLSKLTDFWGFRVGIKTKGFFEIKSLSYVIEIGAGAW